MLSSLLIPGFLDMGRPMIYLNSLVVGEINNSYFVQFLQ